MKWRRRLRQWVEALRVAHGHGVAIPWGGMALALLSGPVPRAVWRARMRDGCMRCPLYSTVQIAGTSKRTDALHLCWSTHPKLRGVGCHCAVNISAITANPYGVGCYGRTLDPDLGWGAYQWPSRWARIKAVFCFILDIRY